LIPAAGHGVRFGGATRKQYAPLLGKPVLAHSIDALLAHPAVRAVTVAVAADDGLFGELIQPRYPLVDAVQGGAFRAQTVLNGLLHIRHHDQNCDWVLVHDAARPCLDQQSLDRLMQQGLHTGDGGLLAMPISDTLKRADDTRVEHTLDRTGLWAAQTPQLFPLQALLDSLQSAVQVGSGAGAMPTDEAAAMERAGFHPLLVRGSASNIKITVPEDLLLAECILRAARPDLADDHSSAC
jgi:2-C-methyl-D-erythritol 4-phosphate cytidylyltransferase